MTPEASTTATVSKGVHVVRTIATGLDTPWGLALLPDGKHLLVTTRDDGRIRRIGLNGSRVLVGRVAGVDYNGRTGGEGGLLGIAISPHFGTDHRIYVYYSTSRDNRIAWYTYNPA